MNDTTDSAARPVCEFYFDFGSPAAWLAHRALPSIVEETGAELHYKPVLLGGLFQATGNRPPITVPAKGRYMLRDLQRYADRYGVPLQFSAAFPINTLKLMRIATGLQQRDTALFERYVETVFSAMWTTGANTGDEAVLRDTLSAAGFDVEALLALADDAEVKARLKQDTDDAVQRGMFGLPVFIVGEEMYWGQDRLDFVRDALAAR